MIDLLHGEQLDIRRRTVGLVHAPQDSKRMLSNERGWKIRQWGLELQPFLVKKV